MQTENVEPKADGSNNSADPKLLHDTPEGRDELGGSHERVADAVFRIIQGNEGGKAIALVGAWGSGKSTVVQLLKKKIENTDAGSKPTNLVFVFDAWIHEGDPLRRALEGVRGNQADESYHWTYLARQTGKMTRWLGRRI